MVLALGQETDSGFLRKVPGVELKSDGTVIVGAEHDDRPSGIFAGGDMVPSERTVTVAVGHGKQAARHIDAWLRGSAHMPVGKAAVVTSTMLHLPVFSDAEPIGRRRAAGRRARLSGFAEVMAGLREPEARYEAQRCLSCGNCFECDNCYAACPEAGDRQARTGPRLPLRLCAAARAARSASSSARATRSR